MPMTQLIMVVIDSAAHLEPDVARRLANELRCTGPRRIEVLEGVVLKHVGSSEMRDAVELVEDARKALVDANCFTLELAFADLKAAERALAARKAEEADVVGRVSAMMAEMKAKGLIVDADRGLVMTCRYFPCKAVTS